jgi:acyl-CoA hydrolase
VKLHVASAYLVFVAIDQNGRRVRVPELKPVTADEERRYADALRRREHREAEAVRRKKARLIAAAIDEAAATKP